MKFVIEFIEELGKVVTALTELTLKIGTLITIIKVVIKSSK